MLAIQLLKQGNWEALEDIKEPVKEVVDEVYLEGLYKKLGWRKFQEYSKKTWNTTDNDKETLFKEILEIVNG